MSEKPEKIGRNDLCYCGSGKKYKSCHMKEDRQKESDRRTAQQAVRFIVRDMLVYARDERFSESFAVALPLFWDGLYSIDNAEEMSQDEALRFFDWFVWDYPLPDGTRVVDAYRAEKMGDLSTAQQKVLQEWHENEPFWAYTLLDYDGQTLHVEDFLTGQSFTVFEASGHGDVQIGEVFLARIVPVLDRLEFSTAAAYIPADEITDLKEKLAQAQETFMADNPEASQHDFMRKHNHLLAHHALEQAKRKKRPQVARLDAQRPDKMMQKVARTMRARIKR